MKCGSKWPLVSTWGLRGTFCKDRPTLDIRVFRICLFWHIWQGNMFVVQIRCSFSQILFRSKVTASFIQKSEKHKKWNFNIFHVWFHFTSKGSVVKQVLLLYLIIDTSIYTFIQRKKIYIVALFDKLHRKNMKNTVRNIFEMLLSCKGIIVKSFLMHKSIQHILFYVYSCWNSFHFNAFCL